MLSSCKNTWAEEWAELVSGKEISARVWVLIICYLNQDMNSVHILIYEISRHYFGEPFASARSALFTATFSLYFA